MELIFNPCGEFLAQLAKSTLLTATLVPEFALEDLLSDRTATLVPAFAVKDLPSGRALICMEIKRGIFSRTDIGGTVGISH